ncbi:MAG: epoxyqueuosine reductase QueH [Acetobacter sp.]|nr:epoxyqueuosine reductase QueH [Acetobacter sp.]
MNETRHKILLLSCCAPCACAVIKKLHDDRTDFAVAFYNPNIHPKTEYEKRRDEQKHLCEKWNIPFIELEYNPEDWLKMATPYKDAPERGARCSLCFEYRLTRVMNYAKENDYTAVASVLGVSRWKDLNQVNTAAFKAAATTDVPYLEIEGRKNGMQQARLTLIKELGLYNQDYCGCIYSMRSQTN